MSNAEPTTKGTEKATLVYRAGVEPMQKDDRLPRSGLWKVVIYEGDRFVRTDKDNLIISVAEKLAEELNYQFTSKKRGKGVR